MEKQHKVFVSSTFLDLRNARQEVLQTLLRADCFPIGMELFPAADEEQFEYIKKKIDASDIYILITAGRYGSIHPKTKLSYTEMEYDYAVAQKKPVIRLLHQDPWKELSGEFVDDDPENVEKLKAFREKLATSKMVRYWSMEAQLGLEVLHGLNHLKSVNSLASSNATSQNNETDPLNLQEEEEKISLVAEIQKSILDSIQKRFLKMLPEIAKLLLFLLIVSAAFNYMFVLSGKSDRSRGLQVLEELTTLANIDENSFLNSQPKRLFTDSSSAGVHQLPSRFSEIILTLPDASSCSVAITLAEWSFSKCTYRDQEVYGWVRNSDWLKTEADGFPSVNFTPPGSVDPE